MAYSVQIIRKQVVKKNGNSQIILRIIIDRKLKNFNTGMQIEPKYWDDKKNIVRNTYPLSIKFQKILDDMEYKAKQSFFELISDEINVSFESFENKFYNKDNASKDFFVVAADYINSNKARFSNATFKLLHTEIGKLKKFKSTINIRDLNYNFYTEYERYLYGIGNHTNTVAKSLKKIRTIENALVRSGVMKKSNSDIYKIKQVPSTREYLTLDELKALDKHYANINNDKLKNVLKNFLFCCYTGIRFQTLESIRYCDIGNDSVLITNPLSVKNNEVISVPLSSYALKYLPEDVKLDNNAGDTRMLFEVSSNQKSNDYIKTIADICGINKQIHFHMARHTFATISLNIGIPIEVVQRLLGHRSIKTTQIYAKIVERTKFDHMKKWDST